MVRKVFIDISTLGRKEELVWSSETKVFIGSLRIENLGAILPISYNNLADTRTPTDFSCSRLYWSFVEPYTKQVYTFSTRIDSGWERNMTCNATYEKCVNDISIVIDHSQDPKEVDKKVDEMTRFFAWIDSAPIYIDEFNDEWIPPCPLSFLYTDEDNSSSEVSSIGAAETLPISPATSSEMQFESANICVDDLSPDEKCVPFSVNDFNSLLMSKTMNCEENRRSGRFKRKRDWIPQVDGNYEDDDDSYSENSSVPDDGTTESEDEDPQPSTSTRAIVPSFSNMQPRLLRSRTNQTGKPKKKEEFKCEVCNKSFLTKGSVSKHLYWCKRKRNEEAEKILEVKENIEIEEEESGSSDSELIFVQNGEQVPNPGGIFPNASRDTNDPMLEENYTEGPVKCTTCGMTYRTKDSFQRHMSNCVPYSSSDEENEKLDENDPDPAIPDESLTIPVPLSSEESVSIIEHGPVRQDPVILSQEPEESNPEDSIDNSLLPASVQTCEEDEPMEVDQQGCPEIIPETVKELAPQPQLYPNPSTQVSMTHSSITTAMIQSNPHHSGHLSNSPIHNNLPITVPVENTMVMHPAKVVNPNEPTNVIQRMAAPAQQIYPMMGPSVPNNTITQFQSQQPPVMSQQSAMPPQQFQTIAVQGNNGQMITINVPIQQQPTVDNGNPYSVVQQQNPQSTGYPSPNAYPNTAMNVSQYQQFIAQQQFAAAFQQQKMGSTNEPNNYSPQGFNAQQMQHSNLFVTNQMQPNMGHTQNNAGVPTMMINNNEQMVSSQTTQQMYQNNAIMAAQQQMVQQQFRNDQNQVLMQQMNTVQKIPQGFPLQQQSMINLNAFHGLQQQNPSIVQQQQNPSTIQQQQNPSIIQQQQNLPIIQQQQNPIIQQQQQFVPQNSNVMQGPSGNNMLQQQQQNVYTGGMQQQSTSSNAAPNIRGLLPLKPENGGSTTYIIVQQGNSFSTIPISNNKPGSSMPVNSQQMAGEIQCINQRSISNNTQRLHNTGGMSNPTPQSCPCENCTQRNLCSPKKGFPPGFNVWTSPKSKRGPKKVQIPVNANIPSPFSKPSASLLPKLLPAASTNTNMALSTSRTVRPIVVTPNSNIAVVRPMEHPLQKLTDQISQIESTFQGPVTVNTQSHVNPAIQVPPVATTVTNSLESNTSSEGIPAKKGISKDVPSNKSIKVTLTRREGGENYSIRNISETGGSMTGTMRSLKIKAKITSGEKAGTSTDVVVQPTVHMVPIPDPDVEEGSNGDRTISEDKNEEVLEVKGIPVVPKKPKLVRKAGIELRISLK